MNENNFFNKLRNEEHRGFEITMFSVSICVAAVMLISVIMLMVYWHRASADRITDEEVDATNVTEAAVTITEKPYDVASGGAVINGNEEDFDDNDVDEELKNADFGYTTSTVNMRSEGSLTASVVKKVQAGAKVKFIELTEDNKWMKVRYEGDTGYINVMYLTTTKPTITATPIPATAVPRRTATPTVTATPKPRKTKRPTKTPKPTKEPEEDEDEDEEEPVVTDAPVTEAPATEVPVTEAPATEVPTEKPTAVPVTAAPDETDASSGGQTGE